MFGFGEDTAGLWLLASDGNPVRSVAPLSGNLAGFGRARLGDLLFFQVWEIDAMRHASRAALWVTDGMSSGTRRVGAWRATVPGYATLWTSDGTIVGTQPLSSAFHRGSSLGQTILRSTDCMPSFRLSSAPRTERHEST